MFHHLPYTYHAGVRGGKAKNNNYRIMAHFEVEKHNLVQLALQICTNLKFQTCYQFFKTNMY